MIFQTFDDKKDCIAVYVDNQLFLEKLPKRKSLTHTWDYSESLQKPDIRYAKYYCGGKSLSEMCPDYLTKEWEVVKQKLNAFHRLIVFLSDKIKT